MPLFYHVQLRAFRVAGNALAFTALIFIAASVWPASPLLAMLLALVAYDQLEDLLGVEPSGRLRYLDIGYELLCAAVGAVLALFGLTYFNYFYAPFHLAILLTGLAVMAASLYDLYQDVKVVLAVVERGVLGQGYWERG